MLTWLVFLYQRRTLIELGVAAAASVLLIVAFVWHERSLGAAACVRADRERIALDDHLADTERRRQAKAIADEIAIFDTTLALPVQHLAPVFLCRDPRPARVRAPATAPPGRDEKTALSGRYNQDFESGAPAAELQHGGAEVGKPLQELGAAADAQIELLQTFVAEVCLGLPHRTRSSSD